MKQDVRLIKLLRLVLLLLVLSLSAMTFTGGGTAEAAEPTYIKIQLEQWKEFKQNTNLLQAKLSLLESALTTQKGASSELLTQLAEAKMQLQEAQQALTTSNRSLVNVKESLNHSEALYKKLTEQMEYDRKRANRIKKQRNIAYIIAGCALCIAVR